MDALPRMHPAVQCRLWLLHGELLQGARPGLPTLLLRTLGCSREPRESPTSGNSGPPEVLAQPGRRIHAIPGPHRGPQRPPSGDIWFGGWSPARWSLSSVLNGGLGAGALLLVAQNVVSFQMA